MTATLIRKEGGLMAYLFQNQRQNAVPWTPAMGGRARLNGWPTYDFSAHTEVALHRRRGGIVQGFSLGVIGKFRQSLL
jgi:hypothetical protein